MMTKPTMSDLMQKVDNRYALVIATAKRARQIAMGDEKLTENNNEVSPVTIAANEINEDKVKVVD